MKKSNLIGVILISIFAVFFISSCTAGSESFDVDSAGFWMGLWHGFISLFTFIISLFNEHVSIYEINNTGKLYNLGFILGIAIFYGGSSKSHKRR